MPSPARSLVAVAAGIILLAVTAWLLAQLAQWQFTAHLRDQAAHALALAATGDTPYRWRLQSADDIVAGRVFGADNSRFGNGELVVSSSGAPFEIGLPLARGVELRRSPHVQGALANAGDETVQAGAGETRRGPSAAKADGEGRK